MNPDTTFGTYEEAVAAVDRLAAAGFPVEHVSIVGHGVEMIEDVKGRFGASRALGAGALTGGLVGLFFGTVFDWWGSLTPETAWLWLALGGAVYGAIVGAVFALVLQTLGSGRHAFSSTRRLNADHYELVFSGGDPAEAMRVLGTPLETYR
jgi:hypothetical protein